MVIFSGLDCLLNHKMIKAGCKDTEEIKEERSSAFHWKFTGFPGNTMSQTLCQLKVGLSSDQYFNLNKTAQRGRTDGEAETQNREKVGQNKHHKCQHCQTHDSPTIYFSRKNGVPLSWQVIFHTIDGLSPVLSGTAPKSISYMFATFTLK